MVGELLALAEHPVMLLVAAALCAPALWPIGRFIFDSLETFKAEAGLGTHTHRALWRLGFQSAKPALYFKIACFICAYVAVVAAMYQLLVRLVW